MWDELRKIDTWEFVLSLIRSCETIFFIRMELTYQKNRKKNIIEGAQ